MPCLILKYSCSSDPAINDSSFPLNFLSLHFIENYEKGSQGKALIAHLLALRLWFLNIYF